MKRVFFHHWNKNYNHIYHLSIVQQVATISFFVFFFLVCILYTVFNKIICIQFNIFMVYELGVLYIITPESQHCSLIDSRIYVPDQPNEYESFMNSFCLNYHEAFMHSSNLKSNISVWISDSRQKMKKTVKDRGK